MGPTKYRTSDDLWRTRSCMVGGGVLPVITTAPCCQFHDCTVYRDPINSTAASWWLTVSTAAARWRFTFLESISLFPPNGAHWSRSFGTNLDSHTHSDAAPARTLFWHVLQRLLFEFVFAKFWNLSEFTKAGPRTGSDRSGECSCRLRVRLRGAQRCCWTSWGRTTLQVSLSPFKTK